MARALLADNHIGSVRLRILALQSHARLMTPLQALDMVPPSSMHPSINLPGLCAYWIAVGVSAPRLLLQPSPPPIQTNTSAQQKDPCKG
eukprot:1161213-Pelagomonas_calceolata.AAC.18